MSFRIGIIGVGSMGTGHAKSIRDGQVAGAELGALCDTDPKTIERLKAEFGETVQYFDSADALFAAKAVDGILIATPHYDHPPLVIAGLQSGHHMLSEKPAGVYTRQVREMNEVAETSDKIFGIMFNQRTIAAHRKMKELIDDGEIGVIKRNNWIITNWYRPQSYYNSGGWRATWGGEGGGVLLNQCPHNLDLWQWFCGMPKRVRAFCHFGKWHDIEVDDDVTAYVEYEDGSTGVFITSTADAPGSNRFEICGDKAKIILEGDKLTLWRNRVPERQFIKEYTGGFGQPEVWKSEIPLPKKGRQHPEVIEKWVAAAVDNDPSKLIASGQEGINSLQLSNAMLLSAWTDAWVDLPVDEDLFYEKLQEKIKTSTFVKEAKDAGPMDTTGTY